MSSKENSVSQEQRALASGHLRQAGLGPDLDSAGLKTHELKEANRWFYGVVIDDAVKTISETSALAALEVAKKFPDLKPEQVANIVIGEIQSAEMLRPIGLGLVSNPASSLKPDPTPSPNEAH